MPRYPGKVETERRKIKHLCTLCGTKLDNNYKYIRCTSCKDRETKRTKEYMTPEKARKSNQRVKMRVFNAYGGAKCRCCGETHTEFLSIDHIDRESIDKNFRSGRKLYHWLARNNYPKGFQVLCINCNFAEGHFGYCPHNKDSSTWLK